MFSLFSSVFLNMAGFSVLLPSILFALINMGVPVGTATVSLALYSGASFLCGPLLGRLSDRVGRRPVLAASLLVAALAYSGLALAFMSPLAVFAALTVAGAMAGNMSVLFAAVADRTTPEKRAKGMGLMGAGIGLAFTVGPAVGGYLGGGSAADASLEYPSMVSALSAFLAALLILLTFKDTPDLKASLAETNSRKEDFRRESRLQAFRELVARPYIAVILLTVFAFTVALALMEPSLPLLLEARFAWGPKEVGRLFMLVGLILIIVQGGMIAPMTRLLGEVRLVQLGLLLMALGLAVMMWADVSEFMVIGVSLAALGSAFHQSSLASLASKQAGVYERGMVMGVYQSIQSLARAVGPLLAGVFFQVWHGLPLAIGVMLTLVGLFAFGKNGPSVCAKKEARDTAV